MTPLNPPIFSILLLLLPFLASTVAGVGTIGVDWGTLQGTNLMPPDQVVAKILRPQNVRRVRIYNTDSTVLSALANTGIEVTVTLDNALLAAGAASDLNRAREWVQREVVPKYRSGAKIIAVGVGNEVTTSRTDLMGGLVNAMQNVQTALAESNLADAIKVTSPIAFNTITNSFPPSAGVFRPEAADSVMRPMLDFLRRTGSYLSVNIYPYQAYSTDSNISPSYALFQPNAGVTDSKTGLHYDNLFDAELDAVYSAMSALGFGTAAVGASMASGKPNPSVRVSESGHPSKGGNPRKRRQHNSSAASALNGTSVVAAADAGSSAATPQNAQAYNNGLAWRVLNKGGTPLYPDADIHVDIFELFNEDQKGSGTENNYGLFQPDGTPVYPFDFKGQPPQQMTWCAANMNAGREKVQAALDYACGPGRADCGPIQPGAPCFQPDTLEAHATYAFNSYYQKNGRGTGTCVFGGAAMIVTTAPYFGNCRL